MVSWCRLDDQWQLTNAKLTADWQIGSRQLLTDCQTVIVGDHCDSMLKRQTSHPRQNRFNIEAYRGCQMRISLVLRNCQEMFIAGCLCDISGGLIWVA